MGQIQSEKALSESKINRFLLLSRQFFPLKTALDIICESTPHITAEANNCIISSKRVLSCFLPHAACENSPQRGVRQGACNVLLLIIIAYLPVWGGSYLYAY